MNAVGTRNQGDVNAIVHEHPRRRSVGDGDRRSHQVGKIARVEIRFTNLHQVDATGNGPLDLCEEQPAPLAFPATECASEPNAVSDEAKKPSRRHGRADG